MFICRNTNIKGVLSVGLLIHANKSKILNSLFIYAYCGMAGRMQVLYTDDSRHNPWQFQLKMLWQKLPAKTIFSLSC